MRGALTRALVAARIVALALVTSIAAPPPTAHPAVAATEAPMRAADWKAIRDVIERQRKALKADDGRRAFGYASPGIRMQLGSADSFMAMVHSAYAALIDARYAEFLEGAVVDGTVVQPLRLIAADDSVLVALYTMEKQKDGQWKIAGCVLAPSTVRAT